MAFLFQISFGGGVMRISFGGDMHIHEANNASLIKKHHYGLSDPDPTHLWKVPIINYK